MELYRDKNKISRYSFKKLNVQLKVNFGSIYVRNELCVCFEEWVIVNKLCV